jgi:hypothetical protein
MLLFFPAAGFAGMNPRDNGRRLMNEEKKVVARFKDGTLVKGYVRHFRIEADAITLREPKTHTLRSVPINDLKAVFFVKTFSGYREYVERKAFGLRNHPGCKIYIKFSDRESILGYVDGDVPWDRGFSLAKLGKKAKGFFLVPVDGNSNNNRIFVVGSSIKDITMMTS